nr:HAMP domain-containing protein [Bacilli bacterium]
MIRRSIVLKLWLTILAMVVVVLGIVALYLDQFFASYVSRIQNREITSQILLVDELLHKEPISAIRTQIGMQVSSPLHSHYYLLAAPKKDRLIDRFMNTLTPAEQSSLYAGVPYVGQGIPTFIADPDPTTTLYAVMMQFQPITREPVSLLLITDSGQFVGNPANTISGLILFAVIMGMLMTTGLAFVVSKNLASPLLEMNNVAEEMAKGRFDLRVRVATSDEVGRLGKTLNHVATELERTVRALMLEKEEVAGILEAMTDAVIAFDLTGQAKVLNPVAKEFLQSASDDLTSSSMPIPDVLVTLQEESQSTKGWVQKEIAYRGRELVVTMTPLYEPDDSGDLRGTLAVLRDVTQERRLERLRKDFVANVSHELRTPLSMLQGYSEALLDDFGEDPELQHELTSIIHEETLRMRRLVNELLDLAQLESGQFSMTRTPIDVIDVMDRVLRKFQGLFQERNLWIVAQYEASKAVIEGDADRLEQVLTNLVDNALRHTLAGGVTLRLREVGENYTISVVDTGQGISQEDLAFVFERFYKVDKARTRAKGGTGLGLSIVYNLVAAHQGSIEVTSVVDTGTTFTITLPKYVKA